MPHVYRFLRVFAGPSVVNRLDEYLMASPGLGGRTRINRLENLLCLSEDSHRFFGRGYFVLEPVGDPLSSLWPEEDILHSYDVRFTWVARQHPPAGHEFRGTSKCHMQAVISEREILTGTEEEWDLTQVVDAGRGHVLAPQIQEACWGIADAYKHAAVTEPVTVEAATQTPPEARRSYVEATSQTTPPPPPAWGKQTTPPTTSKTPTSATTSATAKRH